MLSDRAAERWAYRCLRVGLLLGGVIGFLIGVGFR